MRTKSMVASTESPEAKSFSVMPVPMMEVVAKIKRQTKYLHLAKNGFENRIGWDGIGSVIIM